MAGFVVMLTPLHLAGALLVALAAAVVGLGDPDCGLLAILILFPIYPLVARSATLDFHVTGSSLTIFEAWKEVMLATILAGQLGRILMRHPDLRAVRLHYVDLVAASFVVIVAIGLAMNPGGLALNATRLWLFPIGVYVAVRLSKLTLRRYLEGAAIAAAGIASFLLIQSDFLGRDFVTHYWGSATLPVPYTYTALSLVGLRGSGTLASPNEAALVLVAWACMLVAAVFVVREWRRWHALALGIVIVAVTITFSRSGIMGMFAALAVMAVAAGLSGAFTPRRGLALFLITVIAATTLSVGIYTQRGGIGLLTGTWLSISGAADSEAPTGPDASTTDHLKSLEMAADLVEHHPVGLGLGNVGARVDPITGTKPEYVIESYYLTVGASVGWLGFLWSLLMPLAFAACAIQALRRRQRLVGIALLGTSVVVAFVSILLPTMAEPQIAMIPWALAAFGVGVLALPAGQSDAEDAPGEPTLESA